MNIGMNNSELRYEVTNSLVKILKMYGQVSVKQASTFLNLSEDIVSANLKTIAKQKIALLDETHDTYMINGLSGKSYSTKIAKSLDLLAALIKENENINFFDSINQSDNEPLTIFFQAEDNVYDIVYVAKDEEKKINNKMTRLNMDSNFLVIVENEAQVEDLKFNGIAAFYTVNNGEVSNIE